MSRNYFLTYVYILVCLHKNISENSLDISHSFSHLLRQTVEVGMIYPGYMCPGSQSGF